MHSPLCGQISGQQALQQGFPLRRLPHKQTITPARVQALKQFASVGHSRRKCFTCAATASASSSAPGQPRENIRPAYNKYRTRADIEASYLRQWKEVTARGDGGQRRMTLLSVVAWWPLWFKYQVVPGFMRFFWWLLVWAPLTAAHRQAHRYTVKLGARLDASLARRSDSGRETFSLAMVMRRYHHTVSPLASAVYRWRLLKGVNVSDKAVDPASTAEPDAIDQENTVANPPDEGSTSEGFAS